MLVYQRVVDVNQSHEKNNNKSSKMSIQKIDWPDNLWGSMKHEPPNTKTAPVFLGFSLYL